MTFKKSDCVIRKLYCGDGLIPKNTSTTKYSRRGTSHECLKKGFGIGSWDQRKKDLSKNNLQQIIYIGPVYESNFKRAGVKTIPDLLKKCKAMTAAEKKKLITRGCKRKNGTVDQKAFNSVVLFLHDHGQKRLPSCRIVKE